MGVVYKAHDPELDRTVAIKLLIPTSTSVEARARFKREAQAMARLSHPNVVQVYESGVHNDDVFIAMEFIDGVTLRAWQERVTRSWRELLAVYIAAGRGLAAAHDAGIVHRDFKPENVLLGRDNVAKVTDFGLSYAPAHQSDRPPSTRAHTVLDDRLTYVGQVMGTLRYMPPEQLNARDTDTRGDQYSFCVALFEALFNTYPFAHPLARTVSDATATVITEPSHRPGDQPLSLAQATLRGPVLPMPRGRAIPARVYNALVRGLSEDPVARFPSMDELLDALEHDPWRTPKKAALLSVAGLGIAAVASLLAAPNPCEGIGDEIADVWNESRSDRVRAAFTGTDAKHAETSFAFIESRLHELTQEWARARTDTCEARNSASVSEAETNLRIACLDRQRDRLRAIGAQLEATEDPVTLLEAPPRLVELALVESCANQVVIQQMCEEYSPPDETARERAQQLYQHLDESAAFVVAGDFAAALQAVEFSAEAARSLNAPPLTAKVGLAHGRLLVERERPAEAERALLDALGAAERSGCDALAADLYSELTKLAALNTEIPTERGQVWSDHQFLKVQRVKSVGPRLAAAHNFRGLFSRFRTRNLEKARLDYEKALELRVAHHGEAHLEVAFSHLNLGSVLSAQGALEPARKHFSDAQEIFERTLGPEHPLFFKQLNNRGNAHIRAGEFRQARPLLERALPLARKLYGPNHARVGHVHVSLANVFDGLHELDAALEHANAADAAFVASGASAIDRTITLETRAQVHIAREEFERALAPLREALTLYQQARDAGDPEPVYEAGCRYRFGYARAMTGELEAGVAELDAAIATLRDAGVSTNDLDFGYAYLYKGRALLRAGRDLAAVDALERSANVWSSRGDSPELEAEVSDRLARALCHRPETTERARVLAESAQQKYLNTEGPTAARKADALTRWLGEECPASKQL